MNYADKSGAVKYDPESYERLSVEQKTVLALAGLAGERFFHKESGIVYWTVRVSDNVYRKEVPKEIKGLSNADGTGDLDTVHYLMPTAISIQWGKEEEWCNQHLKTAWDLLHQHEEAFLELYEAIRPESKYEFGATLGGVWYFMPEAIGHILTKVKPTI
jgi:hypothetical protein